ncbi:MAG: hypothetical protein O9353_06050, partial [Bacteroidia bacterium]|nr:hypothetical protein [Bacteroidia bacterium]
MERFYKYFFTIDKANSLHQGHATSLNSPDFSIIGENLDHSNEARYFTSFHFNKTDDPKTVWAKGKYLLLLYNGACRIFLYNPLPDPYYI